MPRKRTDKLTPRLRDVLLDIVNFTLYNKGSFPSTRWMIERGWCSSTSHAAVTFEKLEELGYFGHYMRGKRRQWYVRDITINPPHWYDGLLHEVENEREATGGSVLAFRRTDGYASVALDALDVGHG